MQAGVGRGEHVRQSPSAAPDLALVAAASLCCLAFPPLVAFEPQRWLALALVALGTALVLGGVMLRRTTVATGLAPTPESACSRPHWLFADLHRQVSWRRLQPRFQPSGTGAEMHVAPIFVRCAGEAILWGAIAWCVFSQETPLTADVAQVWSARALPLALGFGLWLWLRVSGDWQRRAVVGVTIPTLVALGLSGWPAPPHTEHFSPYYLAVDGSGTLYVTDSNAAVIRVFAPGGALAAKLRPGLSSRQGPPGPGFFPPGPYNDPDQLGVARVTPGASSISNPLQPWPVGADDFWFCGMAVGAQDRLFVPDWMRSRLLRFAPDGKLEASWPLPAGYQPSLGCVTATPSALYLDDTRGSILQIDPRTGHTLGSWSVGEPILGGLSASPSGEVYALARQRVYQLDPATARSTSWALPAATGHLGEPYQAILATRDGRVLIGNLAAHRVDIYSQQGKALGTLGKPGNMPGQFGQVGGLATDGAGALYVADSDSRAVQRFTATGHIDALYWSPDDDEID